MNVEDLYRLLRTGHVQAQGIVDTVSDPLLVLDGSLCIQGASRSFFETFHVDRYETIGKRIYELGNGHWDIPALRLLLTDVIPKAAAVINFRVEHDFPRIGRRTMLLTARTLHHPDNGSHSLLLSMVDATDRYRSEAAKDILFGELRHRMKNMLAVAQSLARQTSTKGRSAEEFRDDFLGRFSSLIEAQDLAFAESIETGLAKLIERIVAPYTANPRAVVVDRGPRVELLPHIIISLGLVLGALSVPAGQVNIRWQVREENRRLQLNWVENGGPPVIPPSTTGFGTKLIQTATTYSLGGRVELGYLTAGLRAEIDIPLGIAPISGQE